MNTVEKSYRQEEILVNYPPELRYHFYRNNLYGVLKATWR